MLYSVQDVQYITEAFERFYDIGATQSGGVTRLGYTATEDEMHAAFLALGEALGLRAYTDAVGNSFLSNVEPQQQAYLIGSHLDSVVDGGRYDGVAGVLAGLMVYRWMRQEGRNIPLKIVAFRCEESSNFGISTLGSALVTGHLAGQDVSGRLSASGECLGDLFAQRGYSLHPPLLGDVKEYLELHIEQGRMLQEYRQQLGIVTTIAGARRFKLHIQGQAEHSGATPMVMRTDAMCAAAELILEIEKIGMSESIRNSVATVSVVENHPNVLNVIPGEVQLQVDTRGVESDSLDEMERRIKESGKAICDRRGAAFLRERMSRTEPVHMDHKMQDKLARLALRMQMTHRRMMSGAGHDAMMMQRICDTAMIFIPCKDGVSHSKHEFTHLECILDGARLMLAYFIEEEQA